MAWEEVHKRWGPLMQSLAKDENLNDPNNPNNQRTTKQTTIFAQKSTQIRLQSRLDLGAEEKGVWPNYTGFLCALGGVCLINSLDLSGKVSFLFRT